MYTTSQLASILGKSSNAIKQWVERHPDYFSDPAKGIGVRNRVFTEEDAQILATINELSNEGFSHEKIAEKLEGGERVDHLDTRMVPIHDAQQIIDASALRSELELVKDERDNLRDTVEQLKQELSDLRYQMGVLQGENNTRKEQLEAQRLQYEAEIKRLQEILRRDNN